MGTGKSPGSKSNRYGPISGTIKSVIAAVKKGDIYTAADTINDSIETAGYLMLEKNGEVSIYGKQYNDHFANITPGNKVIDSVEMSEIVAESNGTWSVHKYDGQVQFPATAVSKRAGSGFLNAIEVAKKPTGANLAKIMTTPNGEYDIFEIKGVNQNAMFRYIAVRH